MSRWQWPWPKTLKQIRDDKANDQDKEEVERRLTYLEAQVRILNARAQLEDERRVQT